MPLPQRTLNALLFRAVVRRVLPSTTPEDFAAACRELQLLRQSRFADLFAQGWVQPPASRSQSILNKCTPSEAGLRCQRSRICPWCFLHEYVVDAAESLAVALGMLPPSGLRLLCLRRVSEPLLQPVEAADWRFSVSHLSRMNTARSDLLQRLPADAVAGARLLTTVAPAADQQMVVTRSVVAIVRDRFVPPRSIANTVVFTPADPLDITSACVWAFQYPSAMMTAPSQQTAMLLNALSAYKLRCSMGTGICANAVHRDIVRRFS